MPDQCMCKSLVESAATCNVCVAKLRETITRLNRRCQEAESAACVKVEEVQKAGPSLGRALAGWSAGNYRRKYDEAQKEIEEIKKNPPKAASYLEAATLLRKPPDWAQLGEFADGWEAAIGFLEERAAFLNGGMVCPSCKGQCSYRNQDYVSHGYYCDPCKRTFSCDKECCRPPEAPKT
jgi:hypothetical protein